MTRTTNARIAGSMLLLYIAIGVTQMVVFRGATEGEGTAARLASMAQHAADVRINVVLGLVTCFVALAVGVAFYSITREQDRDLAMLGLVCRVAEAVVGGFLVPATLGLLALATATDASASDAAATQTIGTFVFAARPWNPVVAAMFFAVGSALFSWLLLRGRMIPRVLAGLGVVASVVLVIGLPLQIAGLLESPVTLLMWLPMAAFEIPAGLWLIIKGVAAPRTQSA